MFLLFVPFICGGMLWVIVVFVVEGVLYYLVIELSCLFRVFAAICCIIFQLGYLFAYVEFY